MTSIIKRKSYQFCCAAVMTWLHQRVTRITAHCLLTYLLWSARPMRL